MQCKNTVGRNISKEITWICFSYPLHIAALSICTKLFFKKKVSQHTGNLSNIGSSAVCKNKKKKNCL